MDTCASGSVLDGHRRMRDRNIDLTITCSHYHKSDCHWPLPLQQLWYQTIDGVSVWWVLHHHPTGTWGQERIGFSSEHDHTNATFPFWPRNNISRVLSTWTNTILSYVEWCERLSATTVDRGNYFWLCMIPKEWSRWLWCVYLGRVEV